MWKKIQNEIENKTEESNQVNRTPQDYTNELIIWILNLLVISENNIKLIFWILNQKPYSWNN